MPTLEFGFVCDRHACVFSRAATRMASEILVLTPVTRCGIWLAMVVGWNTEDLVPNSPRFTNLGECITLFYTSWTHPGRETSKVRTHMYFRTYCKLLIT